jgi:O-antigen ligase
MSTVQKGTEDTTGADRMTLWTLATKAWMARPVFGVGAGNFGRFVFANLRSDLTGYYAINPWFIQGRAIHSIYFEMLSEYGTVGVLGFGWMVVDFLRRLRRLRTDESRARWDALTGGRFDIKPMTLGLEAAMLAHLLNGVFYYLLYMHWFFTLIALGIVLDRVVHRAGPVASTEPGADASPALAGPRGVGIPWMRRGGGVSAGAARPAIVQNSRR